MSPRTALSNRHWQRASWCTAAVAAGMLAAGGCSKKKADEGTGAATGSAPVAGSATGSAAPPAGDGAVAIDKWLPEFQPTTLTKEQQTAELKWFQDAAKPFAGMKIKVVSETITTHEYESKTLAKAFTELTGIEVTHDLIQE